MADDKPTEVIKVAATFSTWGVSPYHLEAMPLPKKKGDGAPWRAFIFLTLIYAALFLVILALGIYIGRQQMPVKL